MANIVITNNGDPTVGDPSISVTDNNGKVIVLLAGQCAGFDNTLTYTVAVVPAG